jgi:hypothetical protein
MTHSFTIDSLEKLPQAIQWAADLIMRGLAGGKVVLTVGREGRNLDQNARLWATLNDVSNQVDWYGQKLSQDDWKHVFTAALEKQRVVPGIDGGFVMCGISTSKMSKQKFCDLLEIINAFGSEKGVRWSDPAIAVFESYREAK